MVLYLLSRNWCAFWAQGSLFLAIFNGDKPLQLLELGRREGWISRASGFNKLYSIFWLESLQKKRTRYSVFVYRRGWEAMVGGKCDYQAGYLLPLAPY